MRPSSLSLADADVCFFFPFSNIAVLVIHPFPFSPPFSLWMPLMQFCFFFGVEMFFFVPF